MKLAIIDDSKFWRDLAYDTVKAFYEDTPVDIELFDSGEAFLECHKPYDIILMDIEMPNKNGFETIAEYRLFKSDCIAIILTTHTEFANKGYFVDAFRYIDKTNMKLELEEALTSAAKVLACNDTISVNVIGLGSLKLVVKNILFIKTYKRNIIVHTVDNKYECSNNIAELESLLEKYGFYRSHRSCLVNLDKVTTFNKRDIFFANNETAYLSSRKYPEMKRKYLERLRSIAMG